MLKIRSTLRLFTLVATVSALTACGSDSPTEVTLAAGTYSATTFRVIPDGAAEIDALALGGSLTITVNANNSTGGTLFLPTVATGEPDFTASMAGTANRTGRTVQFQQAVDSFVRDLDWTISGSTLAVDAQQAGAARFTITLTRQ